MPGGLYPPESVTASWPTPNYVNPVTESHSNAVILALLGTLSLFVVSARMVIRFFIQRNAGLDDYLMLAALIPTYGLAICTAYVSEELMYNRHVWDVPSNVIVEERKMNLALGAQYIYGATLIKLSVLCFDRRLGVNKITPKFLYAVRAAIALVLIYAIVWTVLLFRQCDPFSAYWNQFNSLWRAGHEYTCLDEGANTLANAIVSTLCDVVAFLLPLSLLWRLQMNRRQKTALAGVFGVGLLVCVVGIVRIIYITRLYYLTYDTTWEAYHVVGATAFELLLATICASAPALQIIFRGLRARDSGATSNSNKKAPPTPNIKSTSRARSRPLFDEENGGDDAVRMDEMEAGKNGAKVEQKEDFMSGENEIKRSSTNTSSPGEYEGLDYDDAGMNAYGSRVSHCSLTQGEKKGGGMGWSGAV